MKQIFINLTILFFGLAACSSGKEVKPGELLTFNNGDPCNYLPPLSKITLQRQEFTGESWPEKNRVHSWDTATADAMSRCQAANFRICKHDTAKDLKESTGKTEGAGKFYYKVTVIGERPKEDARSAEEIKNDDCASLKQCQQNRVKDGAKEELLKEIEDRIQKKGCL